MVLNRVSDRGVTRGISVLVWGFEMPKAHAMQAGPFSGKAITCSISVLDREFDMRRSTP